MEKGISTAPDDQVGTMSNERINSADVDHRPDEDDPESTIY